MDTAVVLASPTQSRRPIPRQTRAAGSGVLSLTNISEVDFFLRGSTGGQWNGAHSGINSTKRANRALGTGLRRTDEIPQAQGTLSAAESSRRRQIQARRMGAHPTSSQRQSFCETETTVERHRICLGLARSSLGARLCSPFEVQATRGALSRTDLLYGRKLQTWIVGFHAAQK